MKYPDKEARKQNRLEVLETNHPVCVACGEDDWRCFEQHHVGGKAHSDDLARLCCNCHRKATDDQKDHPECNGKPTQLQSIGHHLLGLADLYDLQVETLRKYGEHLIQSAKDGSNHDE